MRVIHKESVMGRKKQGSVPVKTDFDKEVFKEQVKDNVRTLFRKKLKEASQQQLFQAVAFAV